MKSNYKQLILSATLIIFIFSTCTVSKNISYSPIEKEILKNKSSYFYLDVAKYPTKNKKLPIGIFDSGTGGLTVLDAIVNFDKYENSNHNFSSNGDGERDFNKEYFIYLGDKANMPYGEYSGNNKTNLLKEHVIKDMQFLLGNKYYLSNSDLYFKEDKEPVKAIVIACNTATAYGKNDLENFCKKAGLDIPIIGVIGAGVRGALSNFNDNDSGIIGIMATAGTVASNGYPNTIISQKEKLNYTGNIETAQQAGVGLAAAIDGEKDYINANLTQIRKNYRGPGLDNKIATINKKILDRYQFDWSSNHILYSGSKENPDVIQLNTVENYISYHVVSLLENIKKNNLKTKLKTIILGCTHFPFYSEIFKQKLNKCYNYRENGKYVYRDFMEKNITLVDPAINTAKELYTYLKKENLFNNQSITKSEFYISQPNLNNKNLKLDNVNNFTHDFKYGRDAGNIQQYVKRVPFSNTSFPKEVRDRLSSKIPFTFELIESFEKKNKIH